MLDLSPLVKMMEKLAKRVSYLEQTRILPTRTTQTADEVAEDLADFEGETATNLALKVAKAGDTMSGTLNLPANGLTVGSPAVNVSTSGISVKPAARNRWGVLVQDTDDSIAVGLHLDSTGAGGLTVYSAAGAAVAWIRGVAGSYITNGLNIGSTATATAMLDLLTTAVGKIGLIVKGFSGQTANLMEVQDNSNAILFAIEADGDIRTSRTSAGTTPGTVTKKLPLYDAAGVLLGYVAIYDNIT